MTRILARLPEGRAGQALAVAATACILLAVLAGLVEPALQWFAARQQQLAARQEQIAHILARQDALPLLRKQAEAASAASGNSQVLLPGNSDSIAEANLQLALNALAGNAGASLTSAQAVPGHAVGSLQLVGLQLNVTANWAALMQLLFSIDSALPRMVVNNLSISGPGTSNSSAPTPLQASFIVSALRAGGQP